MIGDNRGISVMHDVVLFSIMISISGAIMLPALITDIPGEIYRDKKIDETAQDILIELMNCRVNEFEYRGLDEFFDKGPDILKQFTHALLGRELLHKTYADIVTECLSSQLRFNGREYNILTSDYIKKTKELLKNFINEQTSLRYNLTVIWKPIEGIDFGGRICIGERVPDRNIYVASSYFSMPPGFIIDTLGDPVKEIENMLSEYKNEKINKTEIHEQIERVIDRSISSFVNGVFDLYKNELRENNSKIVDDLLQKLKMENLEDIVGEKLRGEYNKTLDELESTVNRYLEENVFPVMDKIIDNSSNFIREIINFLLKYIDFYRAKATLIIWKG